MVSHFKRGGRTGKAGLASAVLFLLFMSLNAYGATLTYSPESSHVTVPAGSEGEAPMTVTLVDADYGTYYLWFVDSVEGDLPIEWIEASPSTSFVSNWWSTASTTLKVKVPGDARPGSYSGYVYSKAKKSHIYADEGSGMYLEVYVPSDCGGKPEFLITSFGPETLWSPNGGLETVTVEVEGMVLMPEGCTLFEAGYSVDDEYDVYTGVGEFTVKAGGVFSAVIPVEASREGGDRDGRHYAITLYAEDEAGIGTSCTFEVLVPHDRRK
jgi:hypothetical protein